MKWIFHLYDRFVLQMMLLGKNWLLSASLAVKILFASITIFFLNNKTIIWCLRKAAVVAFSGYLIAPDKRGYSHNIFIICGYSLEVPQWGPSNEYHNIFFHGEIRKLAVLKATYLELWTLFIPVFNFWNPMDGFLTSGEGSCLRFTFCLSFFQSDMLTLFFSGKTRP